MKRHNGKYIGSNALEMKRNATESSTSSIDPSGGEPDQQIENCLTSTPGKNRRSPLHDYWQHARQRVQRSSSIHPDNRGKAKYSPRQWWRDSTIQPRPVQRQKR